MDKIKELLNRKIGPFPAWVWLVLISLGVAVGMYLRSRRGSGEEAPADPAGEIQHAEGFGVPYTGGYVGYPATTPESQYDWFRDVLEAIAVGVADGNRFDDPNDPLYGDYPTPQQQASSDYQIGTYSYQLAGSQDIQSGQIAEIDPALLEGATVFTPSGSFEVAKTYEGERGEVNNYLAVYDNPLGGTKVEGGPDFTRLTKPLSNMIATQDKNCERIRKNPEWYTAEQRAACGV